MKQLSRLASLAALLCCSAAWSSDVDLNIDRFLADEVRKQGIPGLAVAVVHNGAVLYKGAHGVARLGDPRGLTAENVFHLASVSKPFTATAVMQLVEQGKMSLDDTLIEHLPYFSLANELYRDITILHLLNHTSGLPDVIDYEWDKPQLDAGAAEAYVRSLSTLGLLSVPGQRYKYSNIGYDVLGDLIAKLSGQSFESFVSDHILDPLKMGESSFIYPDIDPRRRVSGHVEDPPQISEVYPYNRRHAPSSTLNSSADDMVRWMQALLGGGELDGVRILSSESLQAMWTPTTEISDGVSVGISWFLGVRDGRRTVAHGGGDTGFRSYILLMPDDGIGILLASNWSGTSRRDILNGVLERVLGAD